MPKYQILILYAKIMPEWQNFNLNANMLENMPNSPFLTEKNAKLATLLTKGVSLLQIIIEHD